MSSNTSNDTIDVFCYQLTAAIKGRSMDFPPQLFINNIKSIV